ncbi:MAG TPA: kelch repeat-containing protein [Vicinamibacterales bacterium]|nr:kelch repeat-containing protein [Vicinamibacterales bacterium]
MKMRFVASLAVLAFVGASGFMLRAQERQGVGTWASAGELADAQSGGAAVALDDERTLIVGGAGSDGAASDRIVLINARDHSFLFAGRLLAARAGHTATLTAEGQVLVAGGVADGTAVADVELFNVETGESTVVGTLAQPRSGHAAARLPNGTVLIAGGAGDGAVLRTAETFDPQTGQSTVLSSTLDRARAGASATALIDGRVLVAGGNDGTADLASAEMYDPVSQTFSLVPTALSVARSGHAAILLPHNNGVLIAGGRSNGAPQTAADLFVPAEFPDPYSYGIGTFAATNAMANARAGAAGGPGYAEGYVFVTGGGADDEEQYRFATIKTDKDDYAPGERAVITGTGWQPGEVRLVFQEDPPVHDDYVLTLTADESGNIYWDQWSPEPHDLGVRFYLTASDSRSRAQTTFTDALGTNVVLTSSQNPSLAGQSVTFTATVTQSGTGGGTVGTPVTIGSVTFRLGGNNCSQGTEIATNVALDALGRATAVRTFATAGTFDIRACYTGAGSGASATQDSNTVLSQVVNPVATNTPPDVTLTGDASANEGTTKSYSFSVTDPDSGETFSLLNATCGANGTKSNESFTPATGAGSFDCTFPDGPATSTVSVQVSDGDASDTAAIGVTIANVAPTVTLNGDAAADEGQTKTYTYTVTDPGDDPNPTITESCGANGTFIDTATATHFQCTFADGPASSTVAVTANDGDPSNNIGSASLPVAVANVAPTVALTGDATADEGQTKTYTYTVTDPGNDPNPTVTESCGANGTRIDTATANHFQCTFPDGPASSEVTVTANDGDATNNIGSASVTVTIANAAPTVVLSGDATADEGQTKAYTYTVTDPGNDPTPTITESCGANGTRIDTATANHFQCTFPDGPASSTVTVTANDGDASNNIGSASVTVTIANVAPTVVLTGDAAADEGQTKTYTYTVTDPGNDPNPTITESCGANGTLVNTATANHFQCTFPDGPASSEVRVTADDGDPSNNVGFATVTVTVANVIPVVNAGANATVNEGALFGQNGSFSDPGADTWTATVNYGDGSPVQALALNADKSFSLSHAYGDNSTYTVTVSISDGDGTGTASLSITVNNVAPALNTPTFTFNPYTGAASASINFSDPGWRDTVSSMFDWAGVAAAGAPASAGPGLAPALTGTFTSSHTFAPGCIAGGISVVVSDDDLGQSGYTFASAGSLQVYTVAFMSPLKDGVRNVVKMGNVIPVKLSITDCNGAPVLNKTLSISVAAGIYNVGDVVEGEEVIPTSVSSADTTGIMRVADSHYMYNMATKGLSTGFPYSIIIRDGGMIVATAVVETKK